MTRPAKTEALITATVATDAGTVVYFTCPACGCETASLQVPGSSCACQKCGAMPRLVSRTEHIASLPKRNIGIQILVWLLSLVAPFLTVLLAFMIIVALNYPGIHRILAVYLLLIVSEMIGLAFLTSPRYGRFPYRELLFVTLTVTSVIAPPLMLVYAVVRVGAH